MSLLPPRTLREKPVSHPLFDPVAQRLEVDGLGGPETPRRYRGRTAETMSPTARLHDIARGTWDLPDGPRRAGAPVAVAPLALVQGALVVERLDPIDAVQHREAWADLMTRALEPNVFLDPDFALPAAQHLGVSRRPCFVLVWDDDGRGRRELVAVSSLLGGRPPMRPFASTWLHELMSLGFPVLDRERAAVAFDALLDGLGRVLPRTPGLLFRAVPARGPTADVLRAAATRAGRSLATVDSWERAVLRRDGGEERAGYKALSGKGAKELRRQRRRLAERGTLGYATAGAEDDLRTTVELFLALEARGWKGRAGTALLARPAQTAFSRTATRLLARRGLCRVDSLTLDGTPIAMGIVLTGGDTDALWKIAYREDLARFSPGVQFVLDFTTRQREAGRSASTDSCAIPDHPMIDRLWRDRLALVDLAISVRPGRSDRFRLAVIAERCTRAARVMAKRVAATWCRRSPKAGTRGGA